MSDAVLTQGTLALPRPAAVTKRRPIRLRGGAAYALVGPAIVLMLLMLIGPLLGVIALSFTDYQLGAPSFDWIGLANYQDMVADKTFWISLTNTLTYVVVVVPGSVVLGLGVALLIQSETGMRAFYRTVYFLPVMATLIAMAIVWEFMLHPQFGLVNGLLRSVGLPAHGWLQERSTALLSLCVIGIWQALGFNMVLFLAGLVSIPKPLYDAAEIDGAGSAWSRFRLVTWPLLGPVTVFVVVITGIRSFQVFDTVHVLTKGGPSKSTEVLIHTMYMEGFEFFRSGYAAALTVVFLVFVLALTLVKAQLTARQVHYT
ncbi:sugar ABC transporter permease [Rhodopseudomonas sp. HC1]|uniref:carbohydrate ABC transporter permease n=1 Tax=Rhodopseudomonas infernalis TaxID=2897386 RepID=UPI001EE854C1|nr:sugar ABC transporter permease [Rhodopseudomonas infernalis]MCG6206977.1 sugar ABC transporter permease [Rhodopseudomonas infernalis]